MECTKKYRDRDSNGKLCVESAGYTGDKYRWEKHGCQDEGDCHNGGGNLFHRLEGRFLRRQSILYMALHCLDDDNGVVDYEAYCNHQSHEGDRIKCEADYGKKSERADERHRHSDNWNECGSPPLEEDEHHDDDEEYGNE